MSNKSGTSSQVISLPSGGGALQGIGETFAPDLHTGTGNFTVPISLPPGRNGFQPQLNLVYSTGNGNGPFGLGWGLSIPGISRKTSQGIPRYYDYSINEPPDVFILSGAEDLLPVEEPATGVMRYRPRTEGLFARIDHHHDKTNNYWKVASKDGLASYYGTPGAAGNDPAAVADPGNRGKVCSWMLSRTEDPFGNHIIYDYRRDLGRDGPHEWDQLYLERIRYVDFRRTGTANSALDYLVSVTFTYEERPDRFSSYRCGFEMRTTLRCTGVEVRTHADQERLVRRYTLLYLDQRSDLPDIASRLPANGVSLLSQIMVEGIDEALPTAQQAQSLPPLEFDYTRFDPANRRFQPLSAVGNFVPERSLGHPEYELVSLFGNGLPDVVHMNGTVRYWRNLGGGRFDFPRTMDMAPFGSDLAQSGVQMADLDGDGRTDLLITDGIRGGFFPLDFDGQWDRDGFVRYGRVPTINLESPDVRLMDLDGDGVTDALRTGPSFELYYNDQRHGWRNVELRPREEFEQFPNIDFTDPRVKLADMTGDDLLDMVLVHNGRIDYWPYLGYGRWGRRIAMTNNPEFEDASFFSGLGFDPRRVLLGDIDGDGLADLVYIGSGHITLWINQSGNGWSDPIEIHGTPPITDLDAVRLADMLGTGTAGILWTYDFNSQLDSTYKFLDLTGATKPYLLHVMDNHMGATTHVTYASSVDFYLADADNPATSWRTTLPFPVLVVRGVEVEDYFSQNRLTTTYQYHHGYWDGAEREFRGFGMVEQIDTQQFFDTIDSKRPHQFTPPILTKSWFHQGPVGPEERAWQELDLAHEYWPDDPNILEQPSELTRFLEDQNIPRRVKRDAIRALRGVILRTEMYALDGALYQGRPYTVTEAQYSVGLEQFELLSPGSLATPRPIFFPRAVTQRTTQWERGVEPMTSISFTYDYDKYGIPHRQTALAVPRRRDFQLTDLAAEPYLGTHTITTFARRDDNERYIVDRVASTTSFEIVNDGIQAMFDLAQDVLNGAATLTLFAQTFNYYDGGAFVGLGLGVLGDFGALVRSETLVLTEQILQEAYKSSDIVAVPPDLPPYMNPNGAFSGTAEYPIEFQQLMRPFAGYVFADGTDHRTRGYYVQTSRVGYDFQDPIALASHGLKRIMLDPLDSQVEISYDEFDFLPLLVTDAVGLTTTAEYDYRVLQPKIVTDPNDNQTRFTFWPLGLLREVFVSGKAGSSDGDSLRASTHFEYDFLAFFRSPPTQRQPIFVRTVRNEHHDTDIDISLPERDATIEAIEYSDGFGRLLQTRSQAEDLLFGDSLLAAPLFGNDVLPANQGDTAGTQVPVIGRMRGAKPNVVVSGWQIYDNKGRVVEKFEPYFSAGSMYLSPDQEQVQSGRNVLGQKATMFYDPRGQVIRTLNPDGSEQRVIYGVPVSLDDPDQFIPTPWEAYTYDANDLATLSVGPQPDGAIDSLGGRAPESHHFTPTNVVIDALGRTVIAVERNGREQTDRLITRSIYDIRGNVLVVFDALDRPAFRYVYDLANRQLRTKSIDAGVRRTVLDAVGNLVESRDSKGALMLHAYDRLNRPIRSWARDDANSPVEATLRGLVMYGDDGDPNQPIAERTANQAVNRLGKPSRQYDEAGLLAFEAYDFKGNLLEKVRRVIRDDVILAGFPGRNDPNPNWNIGPFRVDWQPTGNRALADRERELLDTTEYRSSMTYDALNRAKRMQYPQDIEGARRTLRPRYNRAGALEAVVLDAQPYVEHIAYNAKGQRALIAYGNGVMTRYAYDPRTFRLERLRTERFTNPNPLTYRPTGAPLQDFAYEYDLVGNITAIHDRAPESGILNSVLGLNALDRLFTYDPIYRLRSVTGRECDIPPEATPWDDRPRCTDVTRARAYNEDYFYDDVGNIDKLIHGMNNGNFIRTFALVPGTNRLATVTIGQSPIAYNYDPNGNMIAETTSRHFEWNHSDQMRVFRTQVNAAEPSVYAHYLYDAGGQRVKKLVRKQGGVFEATTYIDGVFEHHLWQSNGQNVGQNNHLHVMDDQQRIALVRVGAPHPDDSGPVVQFHLGDHLSSSNLVINQDGSFINREEHTPYGETSFGSFAKKRYRFTGKERDEESGLNYNKARYYAAWLARWISCDPMGSTRDRNLYSYANLSPLRYFDPSGLDPDVKANQAPRTPARGEQYSVESHKNHPPQGAREGGKARNLQGHHSTSQEWARHNVAGYSGRDAPSQLLETGVGKEHTQITNLQNDFRDTHLVGSSGKTNWDKATYNDMQYNAVEHYKAAKIPEQQATRQILEDQAYFFEINDAVDKETGKVIKNANFERNLLKAEAKFGKSILGKGMAKLKNALPLLGTALTIGTIAYKLADGDIKGALREAVSAIPVVGPIIDVGEIAWNLLRSEDVPLLDNLHPEVDREIRKDCSRGCIEISDTLMDGSKMTEQDRKMIRGY